MSYKFSSQKLVRDKTKERIQAKHGDGGYRTLNDDEYVVELKKKLYEEVDELLRASTNQSIANEAADVIQVMYDLAGYYNVSQHDIEVSLVKRYEVRGGFKTRLYQEWFSLADNDPDLAQIIAEPEKYSLID